MTLRALTCRKSFNIGLTSSIASNIKGGLKTRDWKTRDHEKYGGGKRRTGKRGTKSQGSKRQDWKTQDQISRVENTRPPSMER